MGILIWIVLYVVWMVALEIFGGWALLVIVGGLALFALGGIVQGALERRAYRKTVERLITLQAGSSWHDWTLPAPESYALFAGVTKVESDAFKLVLLQMIAMGVLVPDAGEAPEGGEGDTALKRGPAPADALAGSLVPIHRLWVASVGDKVEQAEDLIEEAK